MPEKLIWDFEVLESLKVDSERYVHVHQGPWLGMGVDWDYVTAHAIPAL